MKMRVDTLGGLERTDQATAHFHRIIHTHEATNERILTKEHPAKNIHSHIVCSSKRYMYDGLSTLDFEILEKHDYHLLVNATVDLKFTSTRQPDKMCVTDEVFQIAAMEFAKKLNLTSNVLKIAEISGSGS